MELVAAGVEKRRKQRKRGRKKEERQNNEDNEKCRQSEREEKEERNTQRDLDIYENGSKLVGGLSLLTGNDGLSRERVQSTSRCSRAGTSAHH